VNGGHVGEKKLGANDKTAGADTFVSYCFDSIKSNKHRSCERILLESLSFFRLQGQLADALIVVSEGE
jgi:hypothetical protein